MTTQIPSGDAEQMIDEWFNKYAIQEPDGSLTLVLHEIHGWENGTDGKISPKQELLDLISARDQAQREALTAQLKAKADQLDKIIDNYSIHAARGYPKGTLARRGLKKRIRAALHQIKDPERS